MFKRDTVGVKFAACTSISSAVHNTEGCERATNGNEPKEIVWKNMNVYK